jgi:hypothetical protein
VPIDPDAPLRFLESGYQPDDWVGVLLKWQDSGRTAQRVAPVSVISAPHVQAWLSRENRKKANVYISVNTIRPRKVSRGRATVDAIRHVFLDADHHGADFTAAIAARSDLPAPSYVLHSSSNRVHVFWRVTGFTRANVEALQKHLARELGADPAATACSQTTRLAGFLNHKYHPAPVVRIHYRDVGRVYTPHDFPRPVAVVTTAMRPMADGSQRIETVVLERARRYLAALPPAVTGQRGDLWTFRVCCRLVRGFALSDADAISVLAGWNARCQPPWSERELRDKLRSARRYGREPIGGLAEARPTTSAAADRGHR